MGFDRNLYLGNPDFAVTTSNDLLPPLPGGDRQVGNLEDLLASGKGQEDPITGAEETLQQALGVAEGWLANFAAESDFDEKMDLAFGESRDVAATEALAKAWETGDFSSIPGIEIRPTLEINGAFGAFAGGGNKIYLSQELLEEGDIGAVADVLLEEIGHRVDWQINRTDAIGDEGAIFSAVVRGETLNGEQLQQLKAEDDSATVWLDGQVIEIEQANIGINQTINESLTNTDPENPNRLGRFSDDYSVSGVDDWQQIQINLDSPNFDTYLELLNAATGEVIFSDDDSGDELNSQISFTKYPGVDYLIRATSFDANVTGNYILNTSSLGIASSIVSTLSGRVGTIDSLGRFGQIASTPDLFDIAVSNDGQLYGITSNSLYRIDPSTGSSSRIGNLGVNINALGFDENNILYGSGRSNLYTINLATGDASLVANLGFDFQSSGDLLFDAANNQFFVTSRDLNSDSLFAVSLTGQATKIGEIGFEDVFGLSFENGNLFGFTEDGQRILINPITGLATFDRNLTGFSGQISGAASIEQSIAASPVDPVPVPGFLEFSASQFQINEDGTAIASVTVNRTGGRDGAVDVTVNLSDGTATSDDYNNAPIAVSFAPGETQKTLNIPIVNDTVDEGDETINLTLSNPTGGAAIGQQNGATLIIVNDPTDTASAENPGFLEFSDPEFRVGEDGTPVKAVTVVRTGGTDGTVSVTLNLSDGSARTPDDYNNTPISVSFAPGETEQIVTVPIYNDREQEGNETINLTLSNPTGGAAIGIGNAATLVIDETARRPVLVVPGIVGSFINNSLVDIGLILESLPLIGVTGVRDRFSVKIWNRNRGLPPQLLTIDPIANFYDPLIKTLENVGYVQGQDLFGAAYDWRLPPAPMDDGSADGRISGLSGASITDTKYEHGVDYIGYYLKEAAETWKERFPDAPPLDSVNIISHSTGGLVARAYVQSDAYGDSFESETLGALTLPKIDNFIMLGVPNKGAPLAWNLLNDDWNVNFPFTSANRDIPGFGLAQQDIVFGQLIRKFANVPYQKVLNGEVINGPNPISLATLSGEPESPQHKQDFIEQYVPTIRALSPDYPFLKDEKGTDITVDSIDPIKKNTFLLDLNANDGISSVAENSLVTVIYGTEKLTPTSVIQKDEQEIKTELVVTETSVFQESTPINTEQSFTDFRSKVPEGIWYKPELSQDGDDTVPIQSSFEPFDKNNLSALPLSEVGHNEIPSNKEAQQRILLSLTGLEFFSEESSEQIETSGSLPNVATASAIGFALDPVEGFVVDASGRRLGYSEATGAVTEIPNSVWFGDTEGFGFVFGETEGPLNLELTGLGEDHYVQVSGFQGNQVGGIESSGFLAEGEQRSLEIEFTEISPDSSPDQGVASDPQTPVIEANTSDSERETETALTDPKISNATGGTEIDPSLAAIDTSENESDRSNQFKDIFGIGDPPIVI